jgi:hypothetical protein
MPGARWRSPGRLVAGIRHHDRDRRHDHHGHRRHDRRRFGDEVPRAAARRFNQVAWIAFAVLIVTGIWNVAAVSSEISHSASDRDTLIVKLVV